MRRSRLLLIICGTIGSIFLGIFAWNYFTLQAEMQRIRSSIPANETVRVWVHYKHYIMPSILVYDIRSVDPEASMLDVTRVFFQFAEAMADSRFDRVELAHKGKTKFVLPGFDFKLIGTMYPIGNPIYLVRTLPEKLLTPSGLHAFQTWEGGIIGVSLRQMDDFLDFHHQWYLNDLGIHMRPGIPQQ